MKPASEIRHGALGVVVTGGMSVVRGELEADGVARRMIGAGRSLLIAQIEPSATERMIA